ncbi:hypothetical protein PUN28_001956 [Cardiocondyla obscurior]|uniref:Uncharacterized protein n=1 Tax=Cardiocondyla obscurior TaxID=286306 RepID=A0AAW2GRU4_9HYME
MRSCTLKLNSLAPTDRYRTPPVFGFRALSFITIAIYVYMLKLPIELPISNNIERTSVLYEKWFNVKSVSLRSATHRMRWPPVVIHPSNAYAQLLMVCRRTAARDLRPLIKGRNSRNNATTNSRGRNSTCGDLETAG